ERLVERAAVVGTVASATAIRDIRISQTAIVAAEPAVGIVELPKPVLASGACELELGAIVCTLSSRVEFARGAGGGRSAQVQAYTWIDDIEGLSVRGDCTGIFNCAIEPAACPATFKCPIPGDLIVGAEDRFVLLIRL